MTPTQSHPEQQSRVDNLLINGGMRINQRSGAPYSATGFTLDKWELTNPGVVDTTTTAFVGTQAMVIEDNDGTNSTRVSQSVEDVQQLRGKELTLSVRAQEGPSNPSTNLAIEIWDTDGSNEDQQREFLSLGSTFQEVNVSKVIQSDATQLEVRVYPATGASSLDGSLQGDIILDACSLTVGEFPVEYQPRPIGMEQSLCERYYEIDDNQDIGAGSTVPLLTQDSIKENRKFRTVKSAVPTVTATIDSVNRLDHSSTTTTDDASNWSVSALTATRRIHRIFLSRVSSVANDYVTYIVGFESEVT